MCDQCGVAFKVKSQLAGHIKRIHDKTFVVATPHACTYCEKSFSSKLVRDNHVRSVHTGERPYVCSVSGCDKGFSVKASLTLHLKTAHGIVGPKADRAPRSKRDEGLPPTHPSSSSSSSVKRTVKRMTQKRKPRSKTNDVDVDTSDSSMDQDEDNSNSREEYNLSVPAAPVDMNIASSSSHQNNVPSSSSTYSTMPFFNPLLSQYYQFPM